MAALTQIIVITNKTFEPFSSEIALQTVITAHSYVIKQIYIL